MTRLTRRCVCPGSFDPVTNGHLDVIRRAGVLFDEVIVAVAGNPAKRSMFTVAERVELIRQSLDGITNVTVATVEGGLLVDFCRQVGAGAIVKGLRGGTDFAYELPMALMNRHLSEVETVFLPGEPRFEHVSSSLIKEVAAHGGDVSGLVPEHVLARLLARVGRVGQTENGQPDAAG
ncbi:pantetheine-phosphate adenylyltransferase [Kineosporia rhizophila]|uniref:pantetheine-phosphate adenylyltransferase n=1 Tax=Kineosporia TaxID=49184 RepID=UPI001E2BCD5E|nr:pantetheine-phosphate adenylyltransferase [Kineosporia sp. NBRC 101677]MCE0538986.1 pantetheine-phosphate adenylyltransferase [Kineosporia rhizophila]GLY16151.1 phosphopantetheine adenylyltransferase [Kineosporia sp. NBRC 101677]